MGEFKHHEKVNFLTLNCSVHIPITNCISKKSNRINLRYKDFEFIRKYFKEPNMCIRNSNLGWNVEKEEPNTVHLYLLGKC